MTVHNYSQDLNTPRFTKLDREFILAKFMKNANSITTETITQKALENLLAAAIIDGARVNKGVDKLEEYAKFFKVQSLSRNEALTALKGGLPTPEDIGKYEEVLEYLVAHHPRAKQLVQGVYSSTKTSVNLNILIAAVKATVSSEKPTFQWGEVAEVLSKQHSLNETQIKAYHTAFLKSSKARELWERAGGEREQAYWKLSEKGINA